MFAARPATLPLALCALLLTGCGYVHIGRIDPATATAADGASENSDLRSEKKILQEELALARKEGAALRAALENRYARADGADPELVTRLQETTRELAALRASYARLDADRQRLQSATGESNRGGELAGVQSQLGDTEEKLAAALRHYTELQEETNQLRSEVARVRSENSQLTRQVGELTVQNEQAVAALAQLNSELLAQKDARSRAEQDAQSVRNQLQLVTRDRNATPTLADARTTSASGANDLAATLRVENAPATETPPTAVLKTNPERLRAAAARLAVERGVRYHTVLEGETLERIALKYYGKPERWRVIYAANNDQLRGNRPLIPGMRLEIPGE